MLNESYGAVARFGRPARARNKARGPGLLWGAGQERRITARGHGLSRSGNARLVEKGQGEPAPNDVRISN